MIKQCGRIPFISSSSSSTAETPSPNPLLTATTMSSDVVQPAAKYGVAAAAATLGSAHNVPTNILGALTNNTGGGAFQKTGILQTWNKDGDPHHFLWQIMVWLGWDTKILPGGISGHAIAQWASF